MLLFRHPIHLSLIKAWSCSSTSSAPALSPLPSSHRSLYRTMAHVHLQDEIARNPERITVDTQFGPVKGGRAANGASVFLGRHPPCSSFRPLHDLRAIYVPCAEHASNVDLTLRHLSQRSPTRYRQAGSRTRNLCLRGIGMKTRSISTRANVRTSACGVLVFL